MALEPYIRDDVKRLIAEVYLDKENKGLSSRKILSKVSDRILAHDPNDHVPSLSFVRAYLTGIRKEEKKIIESAIDQPWSFGLLAKYDITLNAVDSLRDVWQLSLALGHTLTVREALWSARLAKGFTKEQVGMLFANSLRYANRERICEVLPKLALKNTSDIDVIWTLTDRERILLKSLGRIPKSYNISEIDLQKIQESGLLPEPSYNSPSATASLLIDTAFYDTWLKITSKAPEALVMYIFFELSGERDRAFAAILRFLSDGPKWNTLSIQQYILLLSGIKACVEHYVEALPIVLREMIPESEVEPLDIIPPELLEMVGYEIDAKEQEKPKKNCDKGEAQH